MTDCSNTITTIITNETERLNQKKQSVNDVLTSKERMIQLNTNYVERTAHYQKMLIAVIIGLAIYLFIYLINKVVPIPDVIFSLILIVVFLVIGIYCFNVYLVIINRDPMDFSKINKPPPNKLTPAQIDNANASNAKSSDIDLLSILDANMCIGSSCCSLDTTVWDISSQKCIDKQEETFDTIFKDQPVFRVVNQTVNTKTFTPSEFDTYSMY
jgi:hypothetical protein